MLSLQPHHIIDLYVLVDDLLPQEKKNPKGGRPAILSRSELVTILIWNSLIARNKTVKDIYAWVKMYHCKDFPRLPRYNGFLVQCHHVTPWLIYVLEKLLVRKANVRLMDSTMVPVCKLSRAESHKVAKKVATFGKNHQGWHYGFKLHASIDPRGKLCGLAFTGANVYDAQMMPWILNSHTKIAVGDGGYTARVMREKIFEKYGTLIVSPPHPKQKRKLITWWQHLLLRMRPKIESVFDYLKEHLGLVTSFPRSIKGYLFHYVRILLGYQVMMM